MSSDANSTFSQQNINAADSEPDTIYEFENFRLDAVRLVLYRDGEPVALRPKAIETLVALVEKQGAIASKDELMKRLWPDTFVEEANLTQHIYVLRKALGRSSEGRELIETFSRRGYRFTGTVRSHSGNSDEMVADSRPASSQKGRGVESIAILPLQNRIGDPDLDFLCDGMTESIINRLSQVSTLKVIARGTAFRYKGHDADPREIGRELGVAAVLEGSVIRSGEGLIIRAELIDTDGGWRVWGGEFERIKSDALELQRTIARDIVDNLHLKLNADEQVRVNKRYTESAQAYDLFIKGRYELNRRLTNTIERAAEYFRDAFEIDPTFAPAYVGLADCYPLLSLYGKLAPAEAYPRAKSAALKALDIDDKYTRAYTSLGVIKLFYEWDWAGAEQAFLRAIELCPGYPDAHQRYGMFLTAVGRFDEASLELEKAIDFDPLSLITRTISGYPYYYSRQFDKAAERFREVIAMDPDYSMAHFRLGLTMAHWGDLGHAAIEIRRSIALSGDRDTIAAHGYIQGLLGNSFEAEEALDELNERERQGFVSSYNRVLINIGLGRTDEALDALERAFNERSYWLIYLRTDPALDTLRPHPRFAMIENRIFGDVNSSRNTPTQDA